MKTKKQAPPVAADPSRWCQAAQGSVPASFTTHYRDIDYRCAGCRAPCVFSARDQHYAYEVRKNDINVTRNLCEGCWKDARHTAAAIADCERQWAASKNRLQRDAAFLRQWLALLVRHGNYSARSDGAAQGMLRKLLARIDQRRDPAGNA